MHPSDDALLAAVHQELSRSDADAVVRHAAVCARCAGRIAEFERADREVGEALAVLDAPAPGGTAALERRSRRSASWRRGAVAAALALLAVSAAALALPRSPLRRWLRPSPRQLPASAAAPAATLPATGSPRGVSLTAGANVEVSFRYSQPSAVVRVAIVDSGAVTVRSLGGDAGFAVGVDRLTVDNRSPAVPYELVVPRTVHHFVLRVAGRPVLELRDGRVVLSLADTSLGAIVIPISSTPTRSDQ